MRKFYSFVLICSMCLMFVGCGTEYEDTNGVEDFSLQTITDENIINLETGASGLAYTEENIGDVLFSSEYSSKNFNGVEQIYLTNYLGASDLEIYIGHLNVKSGNFRLVVINDDKIIYEIPLDTFGETIRLEDLTGTVSIHVAGESAAFEFYIQIN